LPPEFQCAPLGVPPVWSRVPPFRGSAGAFLPEREAQMSRLRLLAKIFGIIVLLLVLGGGGLVAYAAASSGERLSFPADPFPNVVASTEAAVIERGRYLVEGPAHCSQCHSGEANRPIDRDRPDLINQLPLAGGLSFEVGPLGTRYARNLTPDVDTGIGGYTDAELTRAIRNAVLPDGELSFFMKVASSELSDEDLTAVISYLRSLEPVRSPVPPGEWSVLGKVLLTYVFPPLEPRSVQGPVHVPPSDEPSVARGAYLTDHVMLCTSCHTAMDMMTFAPVGPKGGGGLPEPSNGLHDKDMEYVAPNLTSHPTGATGRMDEDTFVARMTAGRVYLSSIMPWENFAQTTESDLRSVYRYLRSLPPVDADVGPSYRKIGWKPEGN